MTSQFFKTVLAIGAHPDDIEFSCLGYLLKLRSIGAEIITYIASTGSYGDSTSNIVRIQESQLALNDISSRFYYRNQAGIHLNDYELLSNEIRGLIIDHKPDLVLIHSQHDTHQEHKYLRDIVITATRRVPCAIFSYKSVSVTASYVENVFIDISEHLNEKIERIQYHKSQSHHEYMSTVFINNYHTSWFGMMHGMRHVETFYADQLLF